MRPCCPAMRLCRPGRPGAGIPATPWTPVPSACCRSCTGTCSAWASTTGACAPRGGGRSAATRSCCGPRGRCFARSARQASARCCSRARRSCSPSTVTRVRGRWTTSTCWCLPSRRRRPCGSRSNGWSPALPLPASPRDLRSSAWHEVLLRNRANAGVDLHWRVFVDSARSAESDGAFWAASNAIDLEDGVPTETPGAADLLLHVCVHGARWSATPPVRWVADAMAILGGPPEAIDWTGLLRQSETRRFVLPLRDALEYLSETFDAPVPAHVRLALRSLPGLAARARRVRALAASGSLARCGRRGVAARPPLPSPHGRPPRLASPCGVPGSPEAALAVGARRAAAPGRSAEVLDPLGQALLT